MAGRKSTVDDLREACVEEAKAIIAARGVEGLSLREVSRRLGVSHQAPYKHFPSRDHILAEVVTRTFASFARHLDARPRTGDPAADLGAMGRAYVAYARAEPLSYRLMYGTPLPDPEEHPEMMRQARHALGLLQEALGLVHAQFGTPDAAERIDQDALFIWSALHGLASLAETHALSTFEGSDDLLEEGLTAVLQRIGKAIGLDGSHEAKTS